VGSNTKEILYDEEAVPSLSYIKEQEEKNNSNSSGSSDKKESASSGSNSDSSSKKSSGGSKPSPSSGSGSNSSPSTSHTANPGNVEAFISAAMAQVGKPYVRGGKGPNSFDCSGFVYYALNQSGNSIGYMTSGGWAGSGYATVGSVDALQRGDIICMSGHVGIYLGGGSMVDASSSKGQVVVRSVGPWARSNFICGKRPL
jgi:cell wall-associated NlpC family hydrolase